MNKLQSDGIISELIQKNGENEFVVSTGKKLFCSAELAEKFDCRLYSYRDEQLYGFTSEKSGKYQAVAKLGEMHIKRRIRLLFQLNLTLLSRNLRICFANVPVYLTLVVEKVKMPFI